MQASIGKRALASFTLSALVASGCSAPRSAMAPTAPTVSAARDMAAPGPAMAGAVQVATETKPEGRAAQETWRRSSIAANTARVMVGDHEELPLRGLQAQVTIDGF